MGEEGSTGCHAKPSGLCSEYWRQQLTILQKLDTNSSTSVWLLSLLCGRELQAEKERGDREQAGASTIRNSRKGNRKGGPFKAHRDQFILHIS